MSVRFSVKRDDLSMWLNVLAKSFVFAGQFNEIFQCLRFTVVGEKLFLEATDNISYLKTEIPFQLLSGSDESFLIKEDLVRKIVFSSGKDEIVFDVGDAIKLTTESVYRLPIIDGEHYPVYEIPDQNSFVNMKGGFEFLSILDKMVPFISKELVRPELAGISISKHLYTSSDGYHGVVHLREDDFFEIMTLYPYFVKLLILMGKVDGLRFYKAEDSVWVAGDSFCYSCRLPADDFPYSSVYKALENRMDYGYSVKIDRNNLINAFDRVLVLLDDKMGQVKITLDKGSMNVYHRSLKSFSVSEECVSCQGNVENPIVIFIGVNCVHSLKKLFEGLEGDLGISVNSGTQPVFVQHEKSDYTFFFMPMREIPV